MSNKDIKLGELLLNLVCWALFAVAIVAFVSMVFGCSLAEWKDVGEDAGTVAVKAIPNIAVSPNPASLIVEICTALGAIVAGWYTRKFVEKRYAKKELSNAP